MLIASKNISLSLPFDSRIEYLESTGTQWLNPESVLAEGDEFEFDFEIVKYNQYDTIFGIYFLDGTLDFMTFRMNSPDFQDLTSAIQYSVPCKERSRYKFILKNSGKESSCLVDGKDFYKLYRNPKSPLFLKFDLQYFLFGLNYVKFPSMSSTCTSLSLIRLHSFKQIRKNGEIARDLFPVRIGEDGYAYDKVSNQLFGNQGSGKFVLGPDMSETM